MFLHVEFLYIDYVHGVRFKVYFLLQIWAQIRQIAVFLKYFDNCCIYLSSAYASLINTNYDTSTICKNTISS